MPLHKVFARPLLELHEVACVCMGVEIVGGRSEGEAVKFHLLQLLVSHQGFVLYY